MTVTALKYEIYSKFIAFSSAFLFIIRALCVFGQTLYIGMTSQSPKKRFEQHKNGYRSKKGHKLSSNIVRKYGLYLRPSLYHHLGPMTRSAALKMEKKLALELRSQRYAVWFN